LLTRATCVRQTCFCPFVMRSLAAVFACAICLLGAAASPAAAHTLQVGMADDGALLGPDGDANAQAWADLGVDAARLQVSWAHVAPDPQDRGRPATFDPYNPDDPLYDWSTIDLEVGRLVAHGIRPILMIDGPAPVWATYQPAIDNPRYRPVAWQYAAFASAVAKRYGTYVSEYIVWNEPNLPMSLQPQANCNRQPCTPLSPDAYRFMARDAYPAIHAADADAKVLIGALAPRGSNLRTRNANMRPLQFLRALGCVDENMHALHTPSCVHFQPVLADGIAYHAHSTKLAPTEAYDNPDDADLASLPVVEQLVDRLQAHNRLQGSTRPLGIWLDEYGYQTNPPDRVRGVTPGRQDRYLQQAAYEAWRDPRVQILTQYVWRDEPASGKSYTGWQSGLFDADGDPKPALAHFDDPFWIDVARRTLWGQVRPGATHDVELQYRPPGAATAWTTLAHVTTAPDGSWYLRTPLEPFASYRAVADDGETSAALVASPAAANGGTTTTPTGPVAIRTVTDTPAAPVPASFTGLSIEYGSVHDYVGSPAQPNPVFGELVSTLRHVGNGAPTLRFGGDSSDQTWWNPTGAPKPTGIINDITPDWLARLNAWESAQHTPLVMGLDLGLDDPDNAAELARNAVAGLPPGSLTTFEIGNEPDLYTQPRTYVVGKRRVARTRKRAVGYDYQQYTSEVDRYVGALAPAAGNVPLSFAAFASPAWDDHEDDLLGRDGGVVPVYSAHAYPLQTCDSSTRRKVRTRYIRALLGTQGFSPIITRANQLVAVAATHGAAVRYSELNSAICGGLLGVSNTFASALWGTDVLFGLAEAGVRNVDFHTWTGARYAPVDFARGANGVVGHVRPLFYAMLLFARATPQGSRLLPAGPNAPGASLKTWATIDPAGTRRIVVINKDLKNTRQVVLRVPRASRATVQYLRARSALSTSMITIAGQTYGASTTDGRLRGKRLRDTIKARNNAVAVKMPPASAALVTVPST
jgi:hypothetical protein